MKYVPPGLPGSIVSVKPRYENFIGLVDCYRQYPAGASFGGYKNSGIGRENPPHDA